MKIAGMITGLTLCWAGSVLAQTTQPAPAAPTNADKSNGALEVRANEAFASGQYTLALPLLQKVASGEKADPIKYGATTEQIRVCEANLALPPSSPAPATPAGGDMVPMSPETRKPHPAPKPGALLQLSIKELGNFEYDASAGGDVPADVKRLSGSKVRLVGFMVPMDQAENITHFALVPSLFSCCFGQPPQVQHTIDVNCPDGKAVSYFPDPIVVEGKLTVDVQKDDGYVTSIFQVEVTSVKPAPN